MGDIDGGIRGRYSDLRGIRGRYSLTGLFTLVSLLFMPRKPRIEYAGAIYHVLSRGNRQAPIFRDDSDCELFLETLGQTCERTGSVVHCYALMVNHWHGLIETPEPNLSVGMKWLQGTYTQRFNRRHKECGHLLQGRYKALLVDPDDECYFQVVSNYIHLNPARAKQIKLKDRALVNYPWSSFPFYVRPRNRPHWLCVDRVLGCWHLEDGRSGRLQYRRGMQANVDGMAVSKQPGEYDPAWSKIRRGWFWGSQAFGQQLLDKLEVIRAATQPGSLGGQEIRLHNERQAEQLKQQGLSALNLSEDDLVCMAKGAVEKKVLVWFIKHQTTVSNAWLSKQVHCGHPLFAPTPFCPRVPTPFCPFLPLNPSTDPFLPFLPFHAEGFHLQLSTGLARRTECPLLTSLLNSPG